jgi:predicted nucleic acid-binding protein
MSKAYAIDTSLFERLLTGRPIEEAERVLSEMLTLQKSGHKFLVSSMVIGEAYIAVQHHYGLGKKEVRGAILDLLTSGLTTALDGSEVLDILRSTTGAGLMDRLIALQGQKFQLTTLTLDRKMASLANCEKL